MNIDEKCVARTDVQRLVYTADEACAVLGNLSRVTLWRLEKRGLISAVPGLKTKLFSIEVLKKFVAGKSGAA